MFSHFLRLILVFDGIKICPDRLSFRTFSASVVVSGGRLVGSGALTTEDASGFIGQRGRINGFLRNGDTGNHHRISCEFPTLHQNRLIRFFILNVFIQIFAMLLLL